VTNKWHTIHQQNISLALTHAHTSTRTYAHTLSPSFVQADCMT